MHLMLMLKEIGKKHWLFLIELKLWHLIKLMGLVRTLLILSKVMMELRQKDGEVSDKLISENN